ncbi:MAG: tyrosine-type recombinase/integrase [Phycisphaeraceae bacterium]
MSGTPKRGRPAKPHRTSWGAHINGLRRRKDGRWVIIATGKTFAEPDERRAVARFRRWEVEQQGETVADVNAPLEAFQSAAGLAAAREAGAEIYGHTDGRYSVGTEVSEPVLWAWLREQLISRPEYVAEQTGIPEVARLADLPKPEPSPTLAAIGQLYHDKAQVKRKQRRQMQLFWNHFREWLAEHNVETLRQLTPSRVAEYGDHIRATEDSLKYVKNRFTSIRGVINFSRKRGLHAADVRHALDCCAVLTAPRGGVRREPHPIDREHLEALVAHVEAPRMQAFLLCMLNLCMYPSEALNLDWGEIDLTKKTVVTDRSKTHIVRVGVLWDRTVTALKEIRPSNAGSKQPVFLSKLGRRWSEKTANVQFRALRQKAGVPTKVKAEDLRDGAYTAAVEAGVELTQAKLLAGHSTGIPDHYAQRRPTMVADAVKAIEEAYFG